MSVKRDFSKDGMYIDDAVATVALNDKPTMAYVLSTIIGKPLHVNYLTPQDTIANLIKRGSRFDVGVTDDEGKRYDVEVQRSLSGSEPKRARFNSALMDTHALDQGEKTENLPETYVVFICEYDIFHGNSQIYHINRYVKETKRLFNDQAHIIYANIENADVTTELGKMLHDFKCPDPNDMYSILLRNRMLAIRNDTEVMKMIKNYYEVEQQEAHDEGFKEGREGLITIIVNMLKKGFKETQILDLCNNDVQALNEAKRRLKLCQ